jgi:activator of HSP90 ATPase
LKVDQIKKYLIGQKLTIGDDNRKLMLTDVKSISGEASIAVVRGQPRMGYDLTFTAELTGVEATYMEGCIVEVEIEELCDDSTEPAGCEISVTKLLDTEQGA